ncbi:hypothetical protein PVK06_005797 [Gossypium arboreum]|uniref:Uncharacterized protein n=1 Tax=Gossypium arboreum TaxID=29729 RepID=A0ABR0QVI6_GOSAR|nr:hypothetical protein PVK06_005797 [Gossypium arboreum]
MLACGFVNKISVFDDAWILGVDESMDHLCRQCSITVDVWSKLNCQQFLNNHSLEFKQWLTWIFESCTTHLRKLIYCALWVIWKDRNRRIYEKKVITASVVVARDEGGTVLFACLSFHEGVAFAFAAEALACQLVVSVGVDKLRNGAKSLSKGIH